MDTDAEATRIISLLKKAFGKHFKVFHKFTGTANEFIKLFSLKLTYIYVCVCIFLCKYVCLYVYFKCVIYVCVCICCSVFVVLDDIGTSFAD